MKTLKLKILLSFFLFVPYFVGQAQTLNLNQFQVEDGMPQSCIYSLTQDNSGNIWIGTMDGVSKYNGLRFENFSFKDSMAEHRVTASCMDKAGNIWFGHWQGGISKYNPSTKRIHIVKQKAGNIQKRINTIFCDKNGSIYFGTNGNGLLVYTPLKEELTTTGDTEKGTFQLISTSNGLSDNAVTGISPDPLSGVFYISCATNVMRTSDFKHFESLLKEGKYKPTCLLMDHKKHLWIGTQDGLLKMDLGTNKLIKYTTQEGLALNYINTLLEDANHSLFAGTYGGGVSKFLEALEENHYNGPLFQTISSAQGLSNDKVLCMMQDREKNIWIGTALNLNQYFDEQFELFGQNEGLKNSLVWSLLQAHDGQIWLGTEGGLVELQKNQNPSQFGFENHTGGKHGGITNTTALCEDKEGNIWFTNYGTGVSCYQPKTHKTKSYSISDGLCNNEVNAICTDKNGLIWFATNNGASRFDLSTEKFETFDSPQLGSNKIFTIYKDHNAHLWFGCLAGKLTCYDGLNFKQYSEKEGYDNLFTISITEDDKGNLWFGSFEKGIYKFDGKTFKNYTTKDGASTNQALMLICDNHHNLWIGNNVGIDKLNLTTEVFKHYGKQDGFLGVEINPNAAIKDADGNLWFGSIIGAVRFSSGNEKNNLVEPVIQLRAPRLFYKEVEIPANHQFKYNKNHLTFDFSGASLTNPKRVKYKYMLEGYDADWSPAQKQNFATYPNLPPGHYVFKVIASNNDDVWNKEPSSFAFVIQPPFWKTWWFWSIISLLAISAVFAFIHFRELKLKKANLLLEHKVQERTEELRKEKEIVERQNQNIKDSIDYAQRIQEAVFVPMGNIQKLLPNFFILFQPKDVVSGDFYWVNEIKGKIIIALADCTGHGVPGAFMSIIGYNLMNNVILNKGITRPASILDELSKDIASTLNANDQGHKVKDGMDVAVCTYDPATKVLEFAGAHNAIYHIRNGQLTEYKADKQPVGKSSMHDASFHFTNHTIAIEPGDYLFMFTDGYADAIGGPKRTKFYYAPFRKLLTESTGLPMADQRLKLQSTLKDWLGEKEQVDDVAVMGIRF